MEQYKATNIKWANWGDLELPFYKQWNEKTKLPNWFGSRCWEYPFVVLNIPKRVRSLDVGATYPFILSENFPNAISVDNRNLNELDHALHKGKWPKEKLIIANAESLPFENDSFDYSFSISAIEGMENPIRAIQEMIRVTKEKVVITMDISDERGISWCLLTKMSNVFNFDIPPIPSNRLMSDDERLKNFGLQPDKKYNSIRVIGIVFESNPEIKSSAIIIPHRESFPFLKKSIEKIEEYENPLVKHHIYVADDFSQDNSFGQIEKKWKGNENISVFQIHRKHRGVPDIGVLLDRLIGEINEKYVTMIDADLFPISNHWISFPVYLLEKYNCSSVGCDTGLSSAYLQDMGNYHVDGIWQNRERGSMDFSLFDNDNFTCTNNFYRTMKTSLAKIVSEQVGFARRPQETDISRFYHLRGGDSGVSANLFLDLNRLGPKFCLPITSYYDIIPNSGIFDQNICGLVLHFCLSSRALATPREIKDPGEKYLWYGRQIKDDNFTEELFNKLLSVSKTNEYEKAERDFNFIFSRYLEGLR